MSMAYLDRHVPLNDTEAAHKATETLRAVTDPVLEARGLARHYGQVAALQDIDLDLRPGEVTALLGDNGAGKSTLISLLSGVARPSAGEIRIGGAPVAITSPLAARDAGIATVFQTLALVDDRDIAENLFLGREPLRFGFLLDRRRLYRDAEAVFAQLRVSLPPLTTPVRALSGGQRQAIAVARTVLAGARIVILDEPTAALGVRETARVLDLVRRIRADGAAVLLVSHNMENVFEIADRAVILRLGRKVADRPIAELTRHDVVSLMTGAIGEVRR